MVITLFPTYVGKDTINAEGLSYRELNEEILRRILSREVFVRVINIRGPEVHRREPAEAWG